MTYEITEAAPLAEREINHVSQIRDNAKESAVAYALKGKENTFIMYKDHGNVSLSRQFEDRLTEPCVGLIDFLHAEVGPYVHFDSVPFQSLAKNSFSIGYQQSQNNNKLYQTPLALEAYDRILKKPRWAQFGFRQLGTEDIGQMIDLKSRWSEEKQALAIKGLEIGEVNSFPELDGLFDKILQVRDEMTGVQAIPSSDEILKEMGQQLTAFYGAFKGDELVSYTQTEGNDHLQAFHSRATLRYPGPSPQEFLDYNVAREFVSRGVKLFDRGFIGSARKGIIGLTEYKKKFGPLFARRETVYSALNTYKTPEREYLDELFRDENSIE